MKRKVLFHQLPPIRPRDPCVAFPILKGFLARNHVRSQTIYWNVSMQRSYARLARRRADLFAELESTPESREPLFYLAPFLLELLRREHTRQNQEAASALHGYLAALIRDAAVQDPAFPIALLEEVREELLALMAAEAGKIDYDAVLLWAISCKYDQWIPGLLLTELARAHRPDLPVVLGGIASEPQARTLMEVFPHASFAIWGEGEIPLLALVRQLERPSPVLDEVPRLLYRRADGSLESTVAEAGPCDLGEDDYTDFFTALSKAPLDDRPQDVEVSLVTSRGCPWANCRFCNLHQGLPYRVKEPRMVAGELRHLATRFGVTRVHFADQDVVYGDSARFVELLNVLAAMRHEEGIGIGFSSDVSPLRLDGALLRLMACAGFDCLLAGFEGMTDLLLQKMNKAHRFAHNVHFLKFADKLRIRVVCNILQGIPEETRKDVLDSAENLHYLRFYPPGVRGRVWISPMRLNAGSPFAASLPSCEVEGWNLDDVFSVYSFLPGRMREHGDRFHLGSFVRPLVNPDLWAQFRARLEGYQRSRREYRWLPAGATTIFQELHEGAVVKEISLEGVQVEVLRSANDEVVTFDEVRRALLASFPRITERSLRDIVRGLQSDFLLYCDDALETVISVVDTSLIPIETSCGQPCDTEARGERRPALDGVPVDAAGVPPRGRPASTDGKTDAVALQLRVLQGQLPAADLQDAGDLLVDLIEREHRRTTLALPGPCACHPGRDNPQQGRAPASRYGAVSCPLAHREAVRDHPRAGLHREDLRPKPDVEVGQQVHREHGGLGEVGGEDVSLLEGRPVGNTRGLRA